MNSRHVLIAGALVAFFVSSLVYGQAKPPVEGGGGSFDGGVIYSSFVQAGGIDAGFVKGSTASFASGITMSTGNYFEYASGRWMRANGTSIEVGDTGTLLNLTGVGLSLTTATASITVPYTTSVASPGAAIINKMAGKSAVASGAASVVITSSVVASTSIVILTPLEAANAADKCEGYYVTPGAGSFTVTCPGGNTAADWDFQWLVIKTG